MSRKQIMMAIGTVVLILAIAIIIGSESYFNHQAIMNASDQCYDKGGSPEVVKSFLGMDYSFSCDM
ncbi:hypothetical protein [Salimicrobium halophilum]|uniref:Uncharacterized protein n=1 Tax=Salimicrobium halophilum TaxID=86666 RepID=A0A1G8R5J3_9BACI|nr:hypothetical protein [Salimicrobium halophilum]SDJ12113.1 hypothetical protein SAMN04490247_0833 [Salimicrobium halophilum]